MQRQLLPRPPPLPHLLQLQPQLQLLRQLPLRQQASRLPLPLLQKLPPLPLLKLLLHLPLLKLPLPLLLLLLLLKLQTAARAAATIFQHAHLTTGAICLRIIVLVRVMERLGWLPIQLAFHCGEIVRTTQVAVAIL